MPSLRPLVVGSVVVALACTASSPRPCPCLPDHRCRQDVCVPLTAEKCNGEDDDANGLVDEGLYRPSLAATTIPMSIFGSGNAFARSGSVYLQLHEAPVDNFSLTYQLLSPAGVPLGGSAELVPGGESGSAPTNVAVTGSASGFLVAFLQSTGVDPTTMRIVLVRIDLQGRASAPEPLDVLSGVSGLTELAIGGSQSEPVVAVRSSTCVLTNCTTSVRAYQPGQAPVVLVTDPSAHSLSLATLSGLVVLGWAEFACTVDGGDCPSSAVLRAVGGGAEATRRIPSADPPLIAGRGSELVALWRDLTDPRQPRALVGRFDAQLQPLGAPVLAVDGFFVDHYAGALVLGSVPTASGLPELAFFWHISGPTDAPFLTRLDPERGRIGADIPIPVGLSAVGLFDSGAGYDVWVRAPDETTFGLLQTRCSEEAPPADGGAADGGAADGGAPDGGAADGGSTIQTCPTVDPDGGAVIQGELRAPGGGPAADFTVFLGGCVAKTDAQGRFAAAGVPAPYDLTVLSQNDVLAATTYLDVDSMTPVIELFYTRSPSRQGTVHGSYPDGTGPGPLDTLYFFSAADVEPVNLAASPFSSSLAWVGASPTAASAVLFQTADDGSFTGTQVLEGLTLTEGATLELGTLAPISIGSRLVSVLLPAAEDALVHAGLERDGAVALISEADVGQHLRVPVLPADFPGTLFVNVRLSLADQSRVAFSTGALGDATNVEVTAPAAPALLSPPIGSTPIGTTTPTFDFSTVPGGSYYVVLLLLRSGAIVAVIGAAPPLRLPDLTPLGLGLQPGAMVRWGASAHFGPPGATSFADLLTGARPFLGWDRPQRAGEGDSFSGYVGSFVP